MKRKEPGLDHIIKLNIKAAYDLNGLFKEFSKAFGKKKAANIMDELYRLTNSSDPNAIYEKKNKDYDIAMLFSGGYDADIIRKTCNWISENQDLFGDEILEIGSDCGFMTTFLGSFFPDKHIVAVDRNDDAIAVTRKNIEKFGLNNVELLKIDAVDLKDRKFDTIFSLRTLHVNGVLSDKKKASEFKEQAAVFADDKKDYAEALISLTKANGCIVSIEKCERGELLFGWIQALKNAGMSILTDRYQEMKCSELGNDVAFPVMVFKRADNTGDAFEEFVTCCAKYMSFGNRQYQGTDAKIMYEFDKGELIKGYEIKHKRSMNISRIILSSHNKDEKQVLFYNNNSGTVLLGYYDVSEKDALLAYIDKAVKESEGKEDFETTEIFS